MSKKENDEGLIKDFSGKGWAIEAVESDGSKGILTFDFDTPVVMPTEIAAQAVAEEALESVNEDIIQAKPVKVSYDIRVLDDQKNLKSNNGEA